MMAAAAAAGQQQGGTGQAGAGLAHASLVGQQLGLPQNQQVRLTSVFHSRMFYIWHRITKGGGGG